MLVKELAYRYFSKKKKNIRNILYITNNALLRSDYKLIGNVIKDHKISKE